MPARRGRERGTGGAEEAFGGGGPRFPRVGGKSSQGDSEGARQGLDAVAGE